MVLIVRSLAFGSTLHRGLSKRKMKKNTLHPLTKGRGETIQVIPARKVRIVAVLGEWTMLIFC
jgi:hypothetical protein